MKEIEELVKIYMPSKESMKIIDEIFTQGDPRYSDPWNHVAVAGFITHKAISIRSTTIIKPKEGKQIDVKGPQQDLKRIAVWLLKQKGFRVENFEKAFSGGIVDVIGKSDDEYILVECGPCRINKAIYYLNSEKNTLWVLINKPHGTVLYEITRGENWKNYHEYHKEKQIKNIQSYGKEINELESKPRGRKLPRILSSEEVAEMFRVSAGNSRDNMLLKCMYYLGFRNSEVRTLRTEDIDTINSTVKVVQGKGKKDRYVPIPEGFSKELRAYVKNMDGFVFGGRSGKEGTLSDRHIRRIVKSYAKTANVRKWEEIHPHTLRHSYATHLQNNGVPLNVIQSMLGHERIETTTIYTHLGIDKAREFVDQAFIKPLPRAPKDEFKEE